MFPGEHAITSPDHPAIVMAASGQIITFAQLDAAANRLSHLFHDMGLRPGDHIAFCLENHSRFFEVCWGAHYAGLLYTATSSRLTADELSYIVNDCGAKVFITSHQLAGLAEQIAPTTPGVELRLMLDGVIDGYDSYESAVERCLAAPLSERVAGADMLYSSGTTGRPKGVKPALQTESLTVPTRLMQLIQFLFGADGTSRYLSPAPLYHAAPLRFCMNMHRLGATTVIMEHFDAEEFLRLVQAHRITHTQVVPTMFVRMLKLDETVRTSYDVSSLRYVVHAAAPCPVPVKHQMMDWFGPVIHEYYAGTEANTFVYCSPTDWLAHPGTVGRPLTGVLHIMDESGENELPPGEPGAIYVSDGGEFEYHNDSDKTRSAHNSKGWTTLGDVGYLDPEGFLFLTDRKAFMIISGGVNIYPQEAENILTMHPAVVDVAVFGVPNEEFGEEVKAVVQPRDMPADEAAATRLAAELTAYCREHLAHYKCPRTIDFRSELPRHPTGKLYKRLLKDEYWAGHSSNIL
ncbi:MAG: acyl-CoA synthetase [Acidimicrobiia bacterium]